MNTLKELGSKIAELDSRITEVFIHSDTPKDPFSGDEIFLVCHLTDPDFTRDMKAFEEKGHPWSLEISETAQSLAQELGIQQEVIVTPFNFAFHANNEYGQYYLTLYLKEGYEPILDRADTERKRREQESLDDSETS